MVYFSFINKSVPQSFDVFIYYYYRNSNPETIQYNDHPKYDAQQNFSFNLSIDSTIPQNSFTVGSGFGNTIDFLNTTEKSGKIQYLIPQSDLQNQGESLKKLTIRMKQTILSELTDSTFEVDNFYTGYKNFVNHHTTGNTIYNFLQLFSWNGTSNIVVDFVFSSNSINSNYTTGCHQLEMDDTGKNGLDCFCQQRWIRLFSNKKTTGAPLAGFESDFGKNIIHYFTIGCDLSIEENSTTRF